MKRLIVCFDGTWNNADNAGGDTNVARISRAILPIDPSGVPQPVLYLRGVGTTGLEGTRIIGGATGLGIDDNIRSGYMFLAQNYAVGDEIYLFGFSRGAFTARSLVGLISAAGLLERASLGALGEAWGYYRTHKPHSPAAFLAQNVGVQTRTDVRITFLGVWDTVGSLGIPGHLFEKVNSHLYGFYDTNACPIVKTARHALAVDEHRDTFVPTLWTGDEPAGSSIQQVWFAGVHSDVGGGYEHRTLADVPLRWMADEALGAGLALDPHILPTYSALDPLAPQHDSSQGFFAIDHFVPTYREIAGAPFPVNDFQRLSRPLEPDGKTPSRTVNERIHASVRARFNEQVQILNEQSKTSKALAYHPPNLASAIASATSAQC